MISGSQTIGVMISHSPWHRHPGRLDRIVAPLIEEG
jgi:hypothetical protein